MKNQPRKKGDKFEKKARETINSGATWFSPLDIDYGEYCVECKYTDKKGFRVSQDLLEKIWCKSLDMAKEPLLTLGIRRNDKQIFILHCRIHVENE